MRYDLIGWEPYEGAWSEGAPMRDQLALQDVHAVTIGVCVRGLHLARRVAQQHPDFTGVGVLVEVLHRKAGGTALATLDPLCFAGVEGTELRALVKMVKPGGMGSDGPIRASTQAKGDQEGTNRSWIHGERGDDAGSAATCLLGESTSAVND